MMSSLKRGATGRQWSAHLKQFASLVAAFLFVATFFSTSSVSAIPDASDTTARWVNDTTISFGGEEFKRTVNGTNNEWVFAWTQSGGSAGTVNTQYNCTSRLKFTVNPYTENGGKFALRHIQTRDQSQGQCRDVGGVYTTSVTMSNVSVKTGGGTDPASGGNTGGGAAAGNSTNTSPTGEPYNRCDIDNELKWLVCPVVNGTFWAVEQLDNMINTLMTIETSPIFDRTSDSSRSYYAVWASFRNLALGIIVIAALVMVISTAFGFELLDAYTIRKLLPRVFLSLILIVLSWPIMEFLITLINDVGNGLRALIYSPFSNQMAEVQLSDGTQFIGKLIGAGAFVALGFVGLLSFAATAFLALIVAFLVLVVREMLIVLLVILAPIGIASLILPNTQKLWQLWQNTLTTLLVAFPIIAAFIALGRVFSIVAYQAAQGQDGESVSRTIDEIIAFLAYFLPYFLLPLAFRMAGGIMATIGGVANNSERGAFDRLKKFRQGKMAENSAAIKAGNRFREGGRIQKWSGVNFAKRGLNRTGLAATTPGLMPGKRREAIDQRRRNVATDITKTAGYQAVQEDDDILRAATYDSAASAMAALSQKKGWDAQRASRAVNGVKASIGFGRPQAIAAAQGLVNTGTGYSNLDDMTETLARAAGGNASTAAGMAGYANAISKQKGRYDLAPGANNVIGDVHARMNKQATRSKKLQMQDAWNSGSLYTIANGKQKGLENFIDHIETMRSSGDPQDKVDAAIAMKELQNLLPSASGANQDVINQFMARAGVYHDKKRTETRVDSRGVPYSVEVPVSVDEQILTSTGATGYMTGDPTNSPKSMRDAIGILNGKARVYDREDMRAREAAGDI